MRPLAAFVLIVGFLVVPADAFAQARARARAAAPTTLTIAVTDSTGGPLAGIKVAASGPVMRAGVTDAKGSVRFTSMRAGSYRVRFEGPEVITLERDVTLAPGQPPSIEVSLSEAPPPPPPPPPAPKPEPEPAAPSGANASPPEARTVSIPDFVERNLLPPREPSKTTLVACGATSATNLIQVREPLKDQAHEAADNLLYVVGGDGLLVMGTQEVPLQAGTFSVVPRGEVYTLQRRGRGGLILLSTLTDTPCAVAK